METTINTNILRVGNFTSSEIGNLMTSGKAKGTLGAPAKTYIEECNMERRLGRSISTEINSKATTWGKCLEHFVFEQLSTEYTLTSNKTFSHPLINYWFGSPDGHKYDEGKTVMDIKCPLTLKSFCQLVNPIYEGLTGMQAINAVRDNHKEGDKYFYQLVSNAILTESNYAELIVFCPYKSQLEEIREHSRNWDGEDQSRFAWINFALDDELPYLPDGGFYKNINIIRFEVPQSDKQELTNRVIEAGRMLIMYF